MPCCPTLAFQVHPFYSDVTISRLLYDTVGLVCDDTVGLSDFIFGRLLYVLEHMKMWLCAFAH